MTKLTPSWNVHEIHLLENQLHKMLLSINPANTFVYYCAQCCVLSSSLSIIYILGGTLADYIQKRCNSLLDEDTILHFFVQILLALYHVHNKLILHRDLKTQNILLDKHQMIVKIGDFGISKILVSKSKAYTVSVMWQRPVYLIASEHNCALIKYSCL